MCVCVYGLVLQTEASGVGKVRHKRLVNLIGCCTEGDERLLVAEYMHNDTLSKHLFHCMSLFIFIHITAVDFCGPSTFLQHFPMLPLIWCFSLVYLVADLTKKVIFN